MKRVFKTDDIAHMWVHQQQNEARNPGGNFYYENESIYSYGRHFPIAVLSKAPGVVYFTTRGYSNTTAKHVHMVRYAASHKTLIYCHNPFSAAQGNHGENLQDFENRAKNIAFNLPTSRKPEKYLNEIAGVRAAFQMYVDHFKIKKTRYKSFVYLFIESKDGGTKATEKERKAIEKRRKEDEKRERERQAKDLENFRTFESQRMWTRTDRDYLRYNKATKRVETSQGIEMPTEAAKRFYKWIKSTVKAGGCDGNCKEEILGYTVQIVNADFIKIGCHVIHTDEYEAIAALLKWNNK